MVLQVQILEDFTLQVVVVDVVLNLLLVLDLLLLEEVVVKEELIQLVLQLIAMHYKTPEAVEAAAEITPYPHIKLQTVLEVPVLSSLHIPPK
jgi:hypothetical protein